MPTTPTLEQRTATAFVAIPAVVTMESMADVLPPLTSRVASVLAEQGVEPSGPPFWRYTVIDMARALHVDVGFPLVDPIEALADGIVAGELPAGTYATTVHVGHPDGLLDATRALLEWADDAGVTWDRADGPDGDVWACRLEEYLSDPAEEPDPTRWRTRLAFKLAD